MSVASSASPSVAERTGLPGSWSEEARAIPGGGVFGPEVRPWNWLELGPEDADRVWALLIGFVAFFNSRYGERPDRRIPPCWAEHGPLVEELTTLVFARWQAFSSEHASVGGAQYWHSYTLPSFYERMGTWLGDGLLNCQQGRHRDPDARRLEIESAWQARVESIRDDDLKERQRRETAGDLRAVTEVAFVHRDGVERVQIRADGSIVDEGRES